MKRLFLISGLCFLLGGCATAIVAGTVTGAAVSTTGAVVGTTAKATVGTAKIAGKGVRAVLPDNESDFDENY